MNGPQNVLLKEFTVQDEIIIPVQFVRVDALLEVGTLTDSELEGLFMA